MAEGRYDFGKGNCAKANINVIYVWRVWRESILVGRKYGNAMMGELTISKCERLNLQTSPATDFQTTQT